MPKQLSIAERWRIISLRFDANFSTSRIASIIPCGIRTVRNIIQLHAETNDVVAREGRGRRAIIDGSVQQHFEEIMEEHPTDTSASIADRLQSRSGVRVSARTVRRIRRCQQ